MVVTDYEYYVPKELLPSTPDRGAITPPTPADRFCLEYFNSVELVSSSRGNVSLYLGEEEDNQPYKYRNSYNRTIVTISADIILQLEYDPNPQIESA